MKKNLALLATTILALSPASALACACGCGVFEVSTADQLPTGPGGMVFLGYDFMDQTHNWSGPGKAPSADNDDKEVRSDFETAGVQYMFNRQWGAQVSIPFVERHFSTADGGPTESYYHQRFGDLRLKGIYSGFSDDMSTGLTFGLKLPTGDFRAAGFDRDVEIGSGSTDILFGGYHMGRVAHDWNWFASGELDQPVLIQDDYRPGSELDATAGVYYTGWSIGDVQVSPMARLIGSQRWHDHGAAADTANTGYQRVMVAPGVEADAGPYKFYGDVEVPVYQYVTGDQIVAPVYFKVTLSRTF